MKKKDLQNNLNAKEVININEVEDDIKLDKIEIPVTKEEFTKELKESKKEVRENENVSLVALDDNDDTIEIKDDTKIEREDKLNHPDYDFSKIDSKAKVKKEKISLKEEKKKEIKEKPKPVKKEEKEKNKELEKVEEKKEIVKDKDEKKLENTLEIKEVKEEKISNKKQEKSKLSIFLLILCLLVLLFYSYSIYKGIDKSSFELLNLLKSPNVIFTLVSFLVVLILFRLNNKKTTPYVFILTLVLVGYTMFSVSYSAKTDAYVLDFINKDVTEVMDWAEANNLELEILHEFSDTVPKNHVIMQQYGIDTLVKDIKATFTVTISDGPNYDKTIVVPNMTGLTFDEVMEYIKENNLNNVEINFIISDSKRDTLIEQVGSGSMKRNDKIVFTFSYGPEKPEKVPVKDLRNLSEFEATAYLKRYAIDYVIEYKNDDKVPAGYVISQSVTDEVVEDKLTLTVSKGVAIKVPNLLKMTTTEITKWAMENNIDIKFIEEYNKDYDKGKVIKSNKNEGDQVTEGETIEVTISKGSMTMPKVNSLAEFKLWANENNIKYEEQYEFSDTYPKDTVLKTFPEEGSKITGEETIILTISQGKKITIPNFVGLGKSTISSKCNALKLTCSFKYGSYSETVKRDIATSQSKKSGTVVAEGTNVTITLSSGIYEKVTIPSFIGKTKTQIQSSCNSLGLTCKFVYNSTYSNETRDTAIKQDKTGKVNKGTTVTITLSQGPAKSYNFVIDGSLLSSGNPEQTKANLQKLLTEKCPGVNFVFSFQPSNSARGFLAESSDIQANTNLTLIQGHTYKVIINS